MSDDPLDDRIIREREFRRRVNVDLSDVVVPERSGDEEERREELAAAVDEALGNVFDPFEQASGDEPGAIQEDGSVPLAPERDIVTEVAVEGERRVNWLLMVAMILVYSAIGIQAGIALSPYLAMAVLLILAAVGFALGERWVPERNMALLGVTWVIIAMKVLYGLAIELNRWDYIGVESLGVLLLFLVAVNVLASYRHDHDAIAAQSTLVLLAIGSTAGSVLGEIGVAVMILVATLLMHGLALHRQSGNLAALGVAASNLWIGMHAITGGFEIGSLKILSLESPLLLFLLLMAVTGINAAMAARFAREDNWFSKAFKALGLGEPGLWGVSISLGMVGALLTVAASREEMGYALGMVSFLGAAFGGSYLSVRGVESRRVAIPLLGVAPVLVLILLAGDRVGDSLPHRLVRVVHCAGHHSHRFRDAERPREGHRQGAVARRGCHPDIVGDTRADRSLRGRRRWWVSAAGSAGSTAHRHSRSGNQPRFALTCRRDRVTAVELGAHRGGGPRGRQNSPRRQRRSRPR
jgi:hypothetical protein